MEKTPDAFALHVTQMVSLIRQRTGAFLIILFGSYAKGLARGDSDIDIAYAGEQTLSAYDNFMLAQELAALLGRDVDLLDLSQVSTVMMSLRFGIIWLVMMHRAKESWKPISGQWLLNWPPT